MFVGTYNKKHPYPRTFPEPNSEVCILRVATCHCYDTEFAAGGIVRLLHFEFVSRQSVPLEELGHSILHVDFVSSQSVAKDEALHFRLSLCFRPVCSKGKISAFSRLSLNHLKHFLDFLDLDFAWMYGRIVVNFLFVIVIDCDRKNVGFFCADDAQGDHWGDSQGIQDTQPSGESPIPPHPFVENRPHVFAQPSSMFSLPNAFGLDAHHSPIVEGQMYGFRNFGQGLNLNASFFSQ